MRTNRLVWYFLIPAAIIMLGYCPVFFGAHFFVHEDHMTVANYVYGNMLGNGWRPEMGLGISGYYADPSMWHPWSVYKLLHFMFLDKEHAYSASIIILGILSIGSAFYFLRKTLPAKLNSKLIMMISILAVFSQGQPGIQYLRLNSAWIIATPIWLYTLKEYLDQKEIMHPKYFLNGVLVSLFVVMFGNLWSFTQLYSLGIIFFIFHQFYSKKKLDPKSIKKILTYLMFAGSFTVLLSMGHLYSFFWEKFNIGYIREKSIIFPTLSDLAGLNWQKLPEVVLGLIQSVWLPYGPNMIGLNNAGTILGNFITPCMPIVFYYFLATKIRKNFWEKVFVGLYLVFMFHVAAVSLNLFGYGAIYSFVNNITSKVVTLYDFFNIGFIFLLGSLLSNEERLVELRSNKYLKLLSAALIIIYAIIFTWVIVGQFPIALSKISYWASSFIPYSEIGRFSKDFITLKFIQITSLIAKSVGYTGLIFYLSTIVSCVYFSFYNFKFFRNINLRFTFFGIYGLLLSWSMYPLSNINSIWKINPVAQSLVSATDRLFLVTNIWEPKRELKDIEKENQMTEKFGFHRNQWGIQDSPGLNFSKNKSFSTIDSGEFLERSFAKGQKELKNLRISYGSELIDSELINLAGVNIYYSKFPLKEVPIFLKLIYSGPYLNLYENLNAWPYFYYAEDVVHEDLFKVDQIKKFSAYVDKNLSRKVLLKSANDAVLLKEFEYGKLKFKTITSSERLLVVNDLWHKNWTAKLENNTALDVIIVNKIFKGILVPPGENIIILEFKTDQYVTGIYIAFISFLILASVLIFFTKKTSKRVL